MSNKETKYVGEESLRTTMEQCIENLDKKQNIMVEMPKEYVRSIMPSEIKETLSKKAPVQITIKDSESNPVTSIEFSIKKDNVEKTSGITNDTGLCIYEDPSIMDVSVMPCSLEYQDKSVDLEVPEDATYASIEVKDTSSEIKDTDGTIDPYKLAPEGALSNWNYTLDEENNIVTLNYYTGSETDVIVYANYVIGGKTYKTQLKSNSYKSTTSEPYMFNGKAQTNCENIKSIIFSGDIDTSNVNNMSHMFESCSSLTLLDIFNFDTSNVTDMQSMFNSCCLLTSLDISSFNTSNVTTMYGMFNNCEKLTSLDVSNFDTSKVTSMGMMFRLCSHIVSLNLSNFDTSNVANMGEMFYFCSRLTEIKVSRNKWIIPSGCTIIDMFKNCGVDHVTYVD